LSYALRTFLELSRMLLGDCLTASSLVMAADLCVVSGLRTRVALHSGGGLNVHSQWNKPCRALLE
jgi:hypothetical protein